MRLHSFCVLLCAELTLAAATPNAPRFAYTFTPAAINFGATNIVVDASGNTYLAGSSIGNPIAATPGAYQSQNMGGTCYGGEFIPMPIPCRNIFVIKLDAFGNVLFATYLGSTANADAGALAVDSEGNVYLAATVVAGPGSAPSVFPVTPGAAFPLSSIQGTSGGFIVLAKLNATGTQLLYATALPGVWVPSIAVDAAGELFFNGQWAPSFGPFPATPGAYQSTPPNSIGASVIGKLNASGSALLFGTYLSGTQGISYGLGIAVNADGSVLTGGTTAAPDFPATAGQFVASISDSNVYLARLSANGTLLSAALLGPAQGSMAVGPNGDIYFNCWSEAYPVTGGGFGLAGGSGNYLVHVSRDGSSVLSSIFLPFQLNALAVDASGNAYLSGTGSLAPTAGAFQPSPLDSWADQAVVAKIAPDGSVLGATYVGARGAPSIAVERDGSVVAAGGVAAVDFLGIPAAGFLAANFFPAITVENAASYVANTAVPGELISLRGYAIGPASGLNSAPAPALGGVQVYFDNYLAPITYASAQQINVQAPWEIAGQSSTEVRIFNNGVEAASVSVPVSQSLPGVFYIDNSDGSPNSPSNPARPGGYISVYGTGGGAMTPAAADGAFWPLSPLSSVVEPVAVSIAGQPATVLYSGSAPTLESGFFQINVLLPADLTAAADFLCLTIGGVRSAPAPISIQ